LFSYARRMHPPVFRRDHRLRDWPGCWLELRSPRCRNTVVAATKMLMSRHGNRTFDEVLGRLRCQKCRVPPAPVFLCATPHRNGGHGGPPPDWAIELVPPSSK
jgi:hypothetical protein